MSERELLTFTSWNGCAFALMGTHVVGAVRERPAGAEWCFMLDGTFRWHPAVSVEAAREVLKRHAADWYDAAHTPPLPGQAERLARAARVGA